MNTRTRTIASFFSVAMAAMLVGAVVTTQIQRPAAAAGAEPRPAGVAAVPWARAARSRSTPSRTSRGGRPRAS